MREVCAATLASVQEQRVLSFALCCSVFQCVAMCCIVSHHLLASMRELRAAALAFVGMCCGVLWCVGCSVVYYVAVCFNMLCDQFM